VTGLWGVDFTAPANVVVEQGRECGWVTRGKRGPNAGRHILRLDHLEH
jgi:hypothetical protein